MRPSTPSKKASKFFGESSVAILADRSMDVDAFQPSSSLSLSAQHNMKISDKKKTERNQIKSQMVHFASQPRPLKAQPVSADQCANDKLLSQLDAVRERPPTVEDVDQGRKHTPHIQHTTTSLSSTFYSFFSSSSSSLPSLYSSSNAQSSASTLVLATQATMHCPSYLLPSNDEFPCTRIDKCKWSLLDETLNKYETQKKMLGRSRQGWKSRRITVNSQLDDDDMNMIEPQACLHSFKKADMDTKESERMILTSGSFAAVVESSKEYGGGKWIIKVRGNLLGGVNKRVSSEIDDGRRNGEWLLQFAHFDRMQVWLKHLKALIFRLKEIEVAFRKGHASFQQGPTMSLRSREKMRAISPFEKSDSGGHQSDAVEELANSTDSLTFGQQQPPSRAPIFSFRPRQSSLVASQTAKGQPRSSSSLSLYTPHLDVKRSRSQSQTIRTSISSVRSHSSPRTSSTVLIVSPSTPTRGERSALPASHSAVSGLTSRSEEEYQQWDSPSSSSSSTQWQSSLSSPVTSIDTRSSFSSQSSPKTPINSNNVSFSNLSKRKEGAALRLESASLRPSAAPQLSLNPSILDSPTDPETQHVEFPLHQDNSNSLLFELLKTKPDLMAHSPKGSSYDSQVGLAI